MLVKYEGSSSKDKKIMTRYIPQASKLTPGPASKVNMSSIYGFVIYGFSYIFFIAFLSYMGISVGQAKRK